MVFKVFLFLLKHSFRNISNLNLSDSQDIGNCYLHGENNLGKICSLIVLLDNCSGNNLVIVSLFLNSLNTWEIALVKLEMYH